jgi:CRP-like cAMP-binding protein
MSMTATKDQILSRLAAIPMFSDLSADSLETLAGMVQYRRYPKGAFIVGQGEMGTAMYAVSAG